MKKFRSLLLIGFVCAIVLSFVGKTPLFTANAATSQSSRANKNLGVIHLVRLKNYLAGMDVQIGNADYNGDKKIDTRDLIILMKFLLGVPVSIAPSLDADGYYNEVVKP